MASNFYDAMAGIQSVLRTQLASEFSSNSIKLAKVDPRRESKFPGFPGLLVMPVGAERVRPGTNERDDVGYPIAVILFDLDRADGMGTPDTTGTTDHSLSYAKRMEWRETIRRCLRNREAPLRQAGGPQCTIGIECIPQEIIVPQKWLENNMWVSSQVFIVWTRETRI